MARAVVKAVRVAGGGGTIANGSSTIDERNLGPEQWPRMATTAGRKASKSVAGEKSMTYERSYPVCTEEPTRREGATGPERPKRMRPDGAVCYVEGKNGGLGVKRRNVKQDEQTGRPPVEPGLKCRRYVLE